MVVITASRHEQRARVCRDRDIEADRFVIERLRLLDASNMKMYVAECGSGWRTIPRLVACRSRNAVRIERLRRHAELSGSLTTPLRARPIRVHLDTEVVGILQIDRFAHEVVGHPRLDAELGEMQEEAAKRGAIGEEDRKVEQAERA